MNKVVLVRLLSFLICFLASNSLFSTTYYSDSGGGDPNDVNKWWKNSNGNGQHPSDFVSGDVFVVQYGHTYTTTNAWNVTGTVQVEGSLTIQTANSIKILTIISTGVVYGNAQTTITAAASGGQFNINAGGQYIFNHTTTNNSTTLFNGTETFASSSIIEFQNFETTNGAFVTCLIASSTNYGNIIWNIQSGSTSYNLNLSNATTRTIAGNFTILKTGNTGSLAWCNNANVARLTISGNFSQSAGTFYVINSGVGGNGAIFEVLGSFTLSGGTFDVGNNFSYNAYTYWGGDVTISGGTFTNGGPNTSNIVYFTDSGTQTFTYSSGTFTTTSTPFVINSGSTVTLGSNFSIGLSLTVNSGGILNIPNPYYTTGAGTTTISSGATLKTGHTDGISTTASTGCLQTTTKSCSTGATYWYNGTSTQYTGDINGTTTAGSLTFDNAQGIRMNNNLIVANGGTFSLVQGYHDLNGYTLQIGTSASANTLSYTAGGLYSKINDGIFTRYIPTGATITPNSGNYYGLFPFAKSSGQLGTVQITTTGTVNGGYITMVPTFGYESIVTCSVADGGNTIVRVQEGATFDITACTITNGTSITLAYSGGTFVSTGTLSNLCLATYTNSVVGTIGTHSTPTGSLTTPTVSRVSISNMSSLSGISCILGSYSNGTPMTYICNLGGTKTVGPTGNYTTLTAAMAVISSSGLSSSLVLELQSTYVSTSETFPILIDPFNCMGSSNTLTIRPASGATGLSISGSNSNSSSNSSSSGIISFNKGDYVTIDGRPGGTGSTSQLTISNTYSNSNSNKSMPAITFLNDANYNCVKYCTIKTDNQSSSGGAIDFIGTSGTGTTGNKYDTISNNTIKYYSSSTSLNIGIYSAGQSGTKLNAYLYFTGNKFVDCQSRGTYLSSNTDACTITSNHFYQSGSFTPSANVYGVHITTGSGYTISSNYIGGQASSCGGSAYTLGSSSNHFFPIYLSVGSTSTTSIQGNVIRNISLTNTDGSSTGAGIFTGIYISGAGSVNIGTTSGNIIGDTTASSSYDIGITSSTSGGLIQGIYCYASGTVAIQNNLIGDFNTSNVASKGYTFYGIYTGNTSTTTISSNTIGSYSTASSIAIGGTSTAGGVCQFFGIYQNASGAPTISSNTISNIAVYGTGASLLYGIYNSNGASTVSIGSNTVKSLSNYAGTSTSAMVVPIYSSAAYTTNVSSNTIHTITCANGYFKGIYLANSSGNNTVSLNVIGNGSIGNIAISSTSTCNALTTDVVNNHAGIVLDAVTNISSLTSNTIKGISGTGASFAYRIAGIAIGTASTPAVTMTNNLVDMIGTSSATAVASTVYGIYSGSTSTSVLTNKKNIIRNLFCANTNAPTIIGWYDNAYNRSYINNFISVKNTDGTSSYNVNSILYGIQTINTSTGKTAYFYYNTVELGGSVSSNPVTAAVYQVSSTANTFIYKNNIFQNNCSSTNSIVFWGASSAPTCTMDYNFYMNTSTGTNFAKVLGSGISSGTFNSASDDYGGTNSTYTTTALTISTDASISTMATVYTGADLHGTTDCTEDIYGTNGNRNTASNNVYKGCYEGAVATYYWVGGAGNWSDYSNHWAYSSGGSPVATAAPTSSIDVVFDYNSGSGTVNLNVSGTCQKLTCSGFTGTIGGTSAINVNDNFTAVSGMSWSHSGNLNLLATSTGKTFSSGGVTITSNLVLNGSGGEYTLQDNTTISGTLTLTAGTLIVGSKTLTLGSNSAPTVTSGVIDATNASAEIAFTNTASITLPSALFSGTISKWKMNGTGGITLGGNTTISGTLILTSGRLTIPAGITFTLGTSSSDATISGGSSSSYVATATTTSVFKQFINNNATYSFPIGDATYYTPMIFTLNSNGGLSSAYLSTYVADAITPGFKEANFAAYISRYWSVTQSGMTSPNYDISYIYDDTDITGTESTIVPVKVSGGTWYKPSNASNITNGTSEGTGSITTGTNTLTWAGLTTFSFDTGAGDEAAALPISLLSFDAKLQDNKVRLDWITASEENNDYFTVERSLDGQYFSELFKKDGAGISTAKLYYFGYDHKPLDGISYYRLKQTDYNGHYSYSEIESISYKNENLNDINFVIFPNPIENNQLKFRINSNINEQLEYYISDALGKVIFKDSVNTRKGENEVTASIGDLEKGIYCLNIIGKNAGIIQKKFMVK